MRKRIALALAVAVLGLSVAACDSSQPSSVQNDQAVTNQQLGRYQKNQPVPQFDWSAYRQTVIDVESAQVHGLATTTFFFNMGVRNPIKSCPSIGFPVASTAQLTNPDQLVWQWDSNGHAASGTVAQQEPNGVYTGPSSGTYVVCVAPGSAGKTYVTYWEGDVQTEGGPAHWDPGAGTIVLDGAPTVPAKTTK